MSSGGARPSSCLLAKRSGISKSRSSIRGPGLAIPSKLVPLNGEDQICRSPPYLSHDSYAPRHMESDWPTFQAMCGVYSTQYWLVCSFIRPNIACSQGVQSGVTISPNGIAETRFLHPSNQGKRRLCNRFPRQTKGHPFLRNACTGDPPIRLVFYVGMYKIWRSTSWYIQVDP